MATPAAFMAGNTTASTHPTCLDPSVNNRTASGPPAIVNDFSAATIDICPATGADLNYYKVEQLTPDMVACSNKGENALEEATPEVIISTPISIQDPSSLTFSLESTTVEPGPVQDDGIAELTHTVTPTEISPELASLEVCGAGHGVVPIDVNVPTTSAFPGSPMWPSSNSGTPESSLPSTH